MTNKRRPELDADLEVLHQRLDSHGQTYPKFEGKTVRDLVEHNKFLRQLLVDGGHGLKHDLGFGTPMEEYNEERATDIVVGAADPFKTLKQVATESGLKPKMVESMLRRFRAQHPATWEETKTLSVQNMVKALDEKISMAMEYIDPFVLSQASFRDLAIGLSIMVEKRQLLSGDPTQIISVEERKSLYEMLPGLIGEAQRRGITIDQVPDEPTRAILPSEPQKELLSKTARNKKLNPPPEDGSLNA